MLEYHFSNNIKDYRILIESRPVDEYEPSEDYEGCYDEYKNKGLFIVTADRVYGKLDYWLGDLIVDKNNKILGGIAFN